MKSLTCLHDLDDFVMWDFVGGGFCFALENTERLLMTTVLLNFKQHNRQSNELCVCNILNSRTLTIPLHS